MKNKTIRNILRSPFALIGLVVALFIYLLNDDNLKNTIKDVVGRVFK